MPDSRSPDARIDPRPADKLRMRNRRNYYRLLHVQRDAPTAVIKASYRAMMQKLRYHPDLGGDEWNATLLNEAMATLGDPRSRAEYDRTLSEAMTGPGRGDARRPSDRGPTARTPEPEQPPSRPGTESGAESGPPSGTGTGPESGTRSGSSSGPRSGTGSDPRRGVSGASGEPARETDERAGAADRSPAAPPCPFCQAPRRTAPSRAPAYAAAAATCARCGAPAQPIAWLGAGAATDRRRLHRQAHASAATLWRHWPLDEPIEAEVSDLSIGGCALDTDTPLESGDVILLRASACEAIGEVRSCRPLGAAGRHRAGVAFLTVRMLAPPGTLHSSAA